MSYNILKFTEISKMVFGYPNFQTLKRQPYVYGYRMRLFMLKYGFVKSLLRTYYVNYSFKRTQKEVNKLNDFMIESIISNSFLSKYRHTCLYALCRFLKPHIVVETGVGLGVSSYFILQALRDNGFGELYSIDYPGSSYSSDTGIQIDESAYTSQDSLPGCLVPDFLRGHWALLLGKSRDKLPSLCKRLGAIDLFFHDSEHTYQNMLEEYETVWPYIQKNGILASHDIDWTDAFNDFVEKIDCDPIKLKNSFGFIINK